MTILQLIKFNLAYSRDYKVTMSQDYSFSNISASYPEEERLLEKSSDSLIPLGRLSGELANQLRNQSIPQLELTFTTSVHQALDVYYREYLRLFAQNQALNDQLEGVLSVRNQLADRYNQIKRSKFIEDSIKRKRRFAREIPRPFYCPVDKCRRGYGSQGSLSHHIRLKHQEYYNSGKYQIWLQKHLDLLKEKAKKQEIKEADEFFQEQSSEKFQETKKKKIMKKGQNEVTRTSLRLRSKKLR